MVESEDADTGDDDRMDADADESLSERRFRTAIRGRSGGAKATKAAARFASIRQDTCTCNAEMKLMTVYLIGAARDVCVLFR